MTPTRGAELSRDGQMRGGGGGWSTHRFVLMDNSGTRGATSKDRAPVQEARKSSEGEIRLNEGWSNHATNFFRTEELTIGLRTAAGRTYVDRAQNGE